MVINIDETNVKLVPQERAGHMSKGAYRLFVQGRPMGRNASLSAQRTTITHVAAFPDALAAGRAGGRQKDSPGFA